MCRSPKIVEDVEMVTGVEMVPSPFMEFGPANVTKLGNAPPSCPRSFTASFAMDRKSCKTSPFGVSTDKCAICIFGSRIKVRVRS